MTNPIKGVYLHGRGETTIYKIYFPGEKPMAVILIHISSERNKEVALYKEITQWVFTKGDIFKPGGLGIVFYLHALS